MPYFGNILSIQQPCLGYHLLGENPAHFYAKHIFPGPWWADKHDKHAVIVTIIGDCVTLGSDGCLWAWQWSAASQVSVEENLEKQF